MYDTTSELLLNTMLSLVCYNTATYSLLQVQAELYMLIPHHCVYVEYIIDLIGISLSTKLLIVPNIKGSLLPRDPMVRKVIFSLAN